MLTASYSLTTESAVVTTQHDVLCRRFTYIKAYNIYGKYAICIWLSNPLGRWKTRQWSPQNRVVIKARGASVAIGTICVCEYWLAVCFPCCQCNMLTATTHGSLIRLAHTHATRARVRKIEDVDGMQMFRALHNR